MTDKIVPYKRPVNWKSLRCDEAEQVIRTRANDTDNVIITDHAFDRVENREIIQPDILNILRTGYVIDNPQLAKKGGWEVIVKKKLRGRREAAVVTVIFKESEKIIIVTVMWVD
jgi:hypothetical protein